MIPDRRSHLTRLQADHADQIARVIKFREDAIGLRARISKGSYELKDAEQFWDLTERASLLLRVSNPELAERAGLGSNFFTTVGRYRRLPKLGNFLKALNALIEVADERLFDVDRDKSLSTMSGSLTATVAARIQQNHAELLALARLLTHLAKGEIEKLDAERPNDLDAIQKNKKQRELLDIFANGFERIAQALADFEGNPAEPVLLGKASEVVNSVGQRLSRWWNENGADAIDWAVRIPAFVGGVAALGWAGANMTVATTAVAALVGGAKVLDAIKSGAKKKSK